jgi:hypothetical protein
MHRIHWARQPGVGAGCSAVAPCRSNGQGARRKPGHQASAVEELLPARRGGSNPPAGIRYLRRPSGVGGLRSLLRNPHLD